MCILLGLACRTRRKEPSPNPAARAAGRGATREGPGYRSVSPHAGTGGRGASAAGRGGPVSKSMDTLASFLKVGEPCARAGMGPACLLLPLGGRAGQGKGLRACTLRAWRCMPLGRAWRSWRCTGRLEPARLPQALQMQHREVLSMVI